jgi:hypothetical protein
MGYQELSPGVLFDSFLFISILKMVLFVTFTYGDNVAIVSSPWQKIEDCMISLIGSFENISMFILQMPLDFLFSQP